MDSLDPDYGPEPFRGPPDAGFTYLDSGRADILSRLFEDLGQGQNWFLISGATGIGKTSFLLYVAEAFRESGGFAASGRGSVYSCGDETSSQTAERIFERCAATGETPAGAARVLLLDDVDRLAPSVRRDLWRRLSDLKPADGRLCVIMTALPPPKNRRSTPEPDLVSAAQRTYELRPVDAAEVADLVQHRLEAAGDAASQPFSADAMERIAYFGKGIPGRIVQLCGQCLALAQERSATAVSADLVKEAAYGLFLPDHLQKLARGLAGHPAPTSGAGVEPGDQAQDGPVDAPPPARPKPARPPALGQPVAERDDQASARAAAVPAAGAGLAADRRRRTPPPAPRWHRFKSRDRKRTLVLAGVALIGIAVAAIALGLRQPADVVDEQATIAPSAMEGEAGAETDEQVDAPAPSADPAEPATASVPVPDRSTDPGTPSSPASPSPSTSAAAEPEAPSETARVEDVDDAELEELKKIFDPRGDDPAGTDDQNTESGAAAPSSSEEANTGSEAPTAVDGTTAESAPAPRATAPGEAAEVAPQQPEAAPAVTAPSTRQPGRAMVTRSSVTWVQSMLARLGYRPGPVDGIMGQRTRAAIRAFQRDENRPADGTISTGLIEALQRRLSPRRQEPQAQDDRSFLQALGFKLDSVNAPAAFQEYCGNNPESWVYDNGTQQFVLCSRAVGEASR